MEQSQDLAREEEDLTIAQGVTKSGPASNRCVPFIFPLSEEECSLRLSSPLFYHCILDVGGGGGRQKAFLKTALL
jgi:hypothetical protein